MAAELGDEAAGEPGVEGLAVADGVVGAGQGEQAVRGGAVLGVLGEAGADEVLEVLGDVREVGGLLGDAVHQGVDAAVGGAEGEGAGGRVGEDRAEAEDVGGRRDPVAAHLLGGHEPRRADHGAGPGQGGLGGGLQGAGDAEVDDARAVDGEQDVGGLEVAVDEARRVDVLQRVGEAGAQDADGALGQRSVVRGDHRLERGARDVPGGQPRHLGLGVGVEHGGRPGAADPPRRRDLLAEPVAELGPFGQLTPDQFHRDGAPPFGARQIDLSHAARAEAGLEAVRPYLLRVPRTELFHRGAASPVTRVCHWSGG